MTLFSYISIPQEANEANIDRLVTVLLDAGQQHEAEEAVCLGIKEKKEAIARRDEMPLWLSIARPL